MNDHTQLLRKVIKFIQMQNEKRIHHKGWR